MGGKSSNMSIYSMSHRIKFYSNLWSSFGVMRVDRDGIKKILATICAFAFRIFKMYLMY